MEKTKSEKYEKPKLDRVKNIFPKALLKAATHLSDSPCGCSG